MNVRTDRQALIAHYNFPLDRFQIEAMDVLDAGESVLVAAPTGSGKTVVAEYGISCALADGKRAFYTAPIKALSNQKFNDLIELYGRDKIGLLTGDNAVNSDAPIVVMTTEVLRNMIYARSRALDDLAVVVLDEVHFIQDTYRGPVWEEVIIHLPRQVKLVCLSATVSNANEVADWISTVRGPTKYVVEEKRPVDMFRKDFALAQARCVRILRHGDYDKDNNTINLWCPNNHGVRNILDLSKGDIYEQGI